MTGLLLGTDWQLSLYVLVLSKRWTSVSRRNVTFYAENTVLLTIWRGRRVLTMAVKFLSEERAMLEHKLMTRIHGGAIAMRARANGRTDRNKMILPMRIFYEVTFIIWSGLSILSSLTRNTLYIRFYSIYHRFTSIFIRADKRCGDFTATFCGFQSQIKARARQKSV